MKTHTTANLIFNVNVLINGVISKFEIVGDCFFKEAQARNQDFFWKIETLLKPFDQIKIRGRYSIFPLEIFDG